MRVDRRSFLRLAAAAIAAACVPQKTYIFVDGLWRPKTYLIEFAGQVFKGMVPTIVELGDVTEVKWRSLVDENIVGEMHFLTADTELMASLRGVGLPA